MDKSIEKSDIFFTEYDLNSKHQLKNKSICFILLGHEIDQRTHELSYSSKKRCEKLAEELKNYNEDDYFVIFMGLGRLQGNCQLSISECMFNFFVKENFTPKHYILEKRSLDSVGDAVFSYMILNQISFNKTAIIITSDWHLERVKTIFGVIFRDFKIKFLSSSENKMHYNDKKNIVLKKEEESIKQFKKLFSSYDPTKNCLYSFLCNHHILYKK